MTSTVLTTKLAAAVAAEGTFTVPYNAGLMAS